MTDAERYRNLLMNAGRQSLCLMSMQHFAALLIRLGTNARALDDDAIAASRAQCIVGLKSSEATGLSIEEEADMLRKALADLEKLLDSTVEMARDGRPL